MNKILKSKTNQLIVFLYILFGIVALLVHQNSNFITQFDASIFKLLNFHNVFVLNFFKTITNFGDTTNVIIIGLVSCIWIKNKPERLFLASTLIFNTSFNYLVKNIFHRTRPLLHHLVYASGYSFPSGHTTAATTLAIVLGLIVYHNTKKRQFPILFGIIAVLVMLSRIILHVHFPSDIVGGMLLASANTLLIKQIIFDTRVITYDS